MGTVAENVLNEVLRLPATERAALADSILSSLDRPDPELDRLWAEEAEARIDAAERGEMQSVSAESIFAKYSD
jgi:putative addiction module component (TIGR02574 family)